MHFEGGIDPAWLKRELEKPGRSQSGLARYLGLGSASIVNRMCSGTRDITAREADGIRQYLSDTLSGEEDDAPYQHAPDLPPVPGARDYVPVEILPTFAGMGGGGTGDAPLETALLPRRLVEDELRARPQDLLIIDVRGDSMSPLFLHGDQLVIDRRDVNPVQPGAFALWADDGYVVKNVERSRGKYRVFSTNPAYREHEYDPDEVKIMGRPVWFARRL